MLFLTGSFNGQIYSATVHSSNGRPTGLELSAKHGCDRTGEDKSVGLSPRERKLSGEKDHRGGWWICALAEESGLVVLRASCVGLQSELWKQRKGFVAAFLQPTGSHFKRPPQTLAPFPTGTFIYQVNYVRRLLFSVYRKQKFPAIIP